MTGPTFRDNQLAMARYLRDPDRTPAPPGIEPRRLAVYEGLVYNNIEGFISSGFPVLRRLYDDEDWHGLVRAFIVNHACHTPYFLEISQEFVQYLLEDHRARDCDPPFLAELAHYEWVELALDVAEEVLPPATAVSDVLAAVPRLSPLAWVLCYQFPVHRIGPDYRPGEAATPTYLAVYRDRQEQVRFMELNGATARLLELTRGNSTITAGELLAKLAAELGTSRENLREFGTKQLRELIDLSVILVSGSSQLE